MRGLGVAMDKTCARVVMAVRKVSLVGIKLQKYVFKCEDLDGIYMPDIMFACSCESARSYRILCF
jgi:hypothetical protein